MTEPTTPGEAPPAALDSFVEHADEIIESTVAAALEFPEETAGLGPDPPAVIAGGLRFTTDGLVTAMRYGTVDLLADQLAWAVERLPHDGVPTSHLVHRLELYRHAVIRHMPPEHASHPAAYIDWMLAHLRQA